MVYITNIDEVAKQCINKVGDQDGKLVVQVRMISVHEYTEIQYSFMKFSKYSRRGMGEMINYIDHDSGTYEVEV